MTVKRLKGVWERHSPKIIGAIVFIVLIFFDMLAYLPSQNLTNLFNVSINVGAISVGFLVTVVTLIIAIKDNPNLRYLSKLKHSEDKSYLLLLIEYIKHAIGISFLVSLLSAGSLLFVPAAHQAAFEWYFRAWFVMLAMFLVSLYRILKILSLLLRDYIKNG